MAYTPQTWEDGVEGGTPINAARLTHMEEGIDTADSLATTAGANATTALANAADAASDASDALTAAAGAVSIAGTANATAAAAAATAAAAQPGDATLTALATRAQQNYGMDLITLVDQAALMSLIAAASSTVAGKVELSTDAEAITGSSTTLAVTPANLTAVRALMLSKVGNVVDLDGDSEFIANYEINDDGTSTSGWPNRFAISFDPVSGETIQTFVNNEYGELRLIAGKFNTVPFRIFERQFNTSTARSTTVPLFEIANNRSDDVTQYKITSGGNVTQLGNLTVGGDIIGADYIEAGGDLQVDGLATLGGGVNIGAVSLAEYIRDTIATAMSGGGVTVNDGADTIVITNKTVVWPTGSEPTWAGYPDGTVSVQYTP